MKKRNLSDKNKLNTVTIPYIDVFGYGKYAIIELNTGYYLLSESLLLDIVSETANTSCWKSNTSLDCMINDILPYMKLIDLDLDYETKISDMIDDILYLSLYWSGSLGYDFLRTLTWKILPKDKELFLEMRLILYMINLFTGIERQDIKLFEEALNHVKISELQINKTTSVDLIIY